MGAWGDGPIDSDGACDWLVAAVTDPMARQVQALLARHAQHPGIYEDELRGAAWAVLRLAEGDEATVFHPDHRTGFSVYSALAEALAAVRNDRDWLDSWSEAEQVVASLDDQIRRLRTLQQQYDGISSPAEHDEAEPLPEN